MSAPSVCAACGRPLPRGGVLDEQQRQVHYVCAELLKKRMQELARRTVKRMTGKPGARPLGPRSGSGVSIGGGK